MATKTTKKAAVKPVAKKTTVKKSVKRVAAKPVMPEMNACACGHDCKCHARRCTFGRVVKKIVIFAIIFALGFAAAKFCPCGKKPCFRGPRVNFVEGCLDASSVKCPKLVEALPAMDINGDGCITHDEFHAVKREMRREIREMPVQIAE